MIVTVMKHTSDGWPIGPVKLTISDKCPVCDGPRGDPYGFNFWEDGEMYHVDKWNNPCGHIDKYVDVIEEAEDEVL